MFKSKSDICSFAIGLVVSTILALVVGLLVTPAAIAWVQYFLIATWIFIALSLLGAVVLSLVTACRRCENIRRQLCKNICLLYIGTIGALITTAIFSLLIILAVATPIIFQVFTAISVFFVGLIFTAILRLVYFVIQGRIRSDAEE